MAAANRARRALTPLLLVPLMSIAMPNAHAAPEGANAELIGLIHRHVDAQREFDVATLQAVTADNYVEVSPAGEVDSRDKMLSFYDPAQRRPAPAVRVDEPTVRTVDQTAIVIARLTYTMNADGQARSFAMRASYVASKFDGKWKLVSAHYTGIRPPKP
jgi:ketosteroid isomerase-like protein